MAREQWRTQICVPVGDTTDRALVLKQEPLT